jgi:ferric-dicitrate binding protein FerR (iron transport regulator)
MTLITYADATREDFVNEKDIVLITPIDKQMCGNSKMATVIQTIEGNHIVNADTVASRVTDMVKKKEKTSAFNQLIIPIGKKSRIVLSDSTEIIANSGSRIIYPIAFRENVREIYIDGEAFLTVKKNDRIPFIVYTHDYEIEVIGTSFNICSYPSEKKSTVVLLNGAINLSGINEEKVTLKPGEKVDIYEGKIEVPEKVDVKQYVSWIDNILVYKDEPLEFVLHRLGIYFGKEFEISQGVKGKSVTGKLEFKEDLFEMLDIISFTASVSFEEQGDKIIVR